MPRLPLGSATPLLLVYATVLICMQPTPEQTSSFSRSHDNIQNVKYDSISAISKDTIEYIIICFMRQIEHSYPAYVVKYQ